jgi:HD-GYP domain-containing protein (c-di-GMP phosphodiesterase class II)
MATERPPILTVGLEPAIEKVIADILVNTEVTPIPMDMDHLLKEVSPPPCMVISGPPKADIPANELAQSLRMQYQDAPIFLCCTAREGFERKGFIKNGFTDAFLMPMDTTLLRAAISEKLAKATKGAIRVYRPIKMLDVQGGDLLDFDTSVYFPVNKKYVKISNSGDAIDPARLEKMKSNNLNNIFVPAEQMQKFYSYTAKKLKDLGAPGVLGATERRDKLSGAVRDLISGMFTEQAAGFESGQAMLKDCGEIVKTYILDGADNEWYSRIQQVMGDRGDSYTHAGNISTLAALFSMGLGVGKPEDLALAGLLHDIGTAELPGEIQSLEPENMTPDQLTEYKKHPEISVNLIKKRKIVVPEIVTKAILQHHELFNGNGYPSGLYGDRICKEAQVLALADRFDYLTRLKDGVPTMTPPQAVELLRREQVSDPSKIHYKPDLLKKLLTLFPSQQ